MPLRLAYVILANQVVLGYVLCSINKQLDRAMDHFRYQNHILYAEDVPIPRIAEEVGTPFYCYSSATLTRHYTVFAEAFSAIPTLVCYSVKANSNLAVLKTLANCGSGADVVSEGEIRRARAASISANKIVFSGVGKTKEEMAYALDEGILQFNVESVAELEALNEVAISKNTQAPIAFRINPDVDAGSNDKITTGRKEDKFGIAWEQARDIYASAGKMDGIRVEAINTHIGSQLVRLEPFQAAFRRIRELVQLLRQDGHNITRLDLGGGLGIPYDQENPPSPADYAAMTIAEVKDLDCSLIFEPGRLIAGNSGILVSKVIYLKDTGHRHFAIIDAAMNDLVRPSMYDAYHEIIPVQHAEKNVESIAYDVVGPVCETGDTFARLRELPVLSQGDLVAFRTCGAYGAVMASTYNSRLMIPEILVNGKDFATIRPRPTYDDMLQKDVLPEWV